MPKQLIDLWDEYVGDGGIHVHESERHFYRRTAPRYKVGEVVAVAQSYEQVYHQEGLETMDILVSGMKTSSGWKNKMFVKAEMMPHQIRISGIHCERLQEITYEDCLKEGVVELVQGYGVALYCPNPYEDEGYLGGNMFQPKEVAARKAFALMIDKVSGRGTWARNPWVVVYEFELVK